MLHRYMPPRSLRSSVLTLLTVPKVQTKSFGRAAFSFYSPKLWNNLPKDLHVSKTVDILKKNLKTYNFRIAFMSNADIWCFYCYCISPFLF
ncbi:hypothetical protein LDENG_00019160 [Lucifuga dentata]|nr:hypothetical protein LDENG_00019160 [Lucifuga dentata]